MVADQTAASSASTAPNIQPDLHPSAPGPSALNPLKEKPKEPEFYSRIEGLCREKLKVWSNEMGEIWFYPNAGFHVSNARAPTDSYGL